MMKRLLAFGTCLAMSAVMATAASSSEKKAVVKPGEESKLKDLPFSPAILKGDTLYVSGQTGYGPDGKTPENFEDEVKTALESIGKTLKQAGYDFSDVVTVNVYLTDMSTISQMNSVYMKYFPVPRPARTTVAVAKLVGTARIEITVMARK